MMVSFDPKQRPTIEKVLFELMKLDIVKNLTKAKILINREPIVMTDKFK